MSEDDLTLTGELVPKNITKDGKWRLPGGVEIELTSASLTLPSERGKEEVFAVFLSPDEHFDSCPYCDTEPADGLLIVMENWFYLAAWCCNQMLLYPKKPDTYGDTEELM